MKGLWELVLSFSLVFLWLTAKACSQPQQQRQVPCFFIFGDSLVDNGNNNGVLTLARANYRPYGIDFPLGFTGRFTNGQTYVDALGKIILWHLQLLDFSLSYILPYYFIFPIISKLKSMFLNKIRFKSHVRRCVLKNAPF